MLAKKKYGAYRYHVWQLLVAFYRIVSSINVLLDVFGMNFINYKISTFPRCCKVLACCQKLGGLVTRRVRFVVELDTVGHDFYKGLFAGNFWVVLSFCFFQPLLGKTSIPIDYFWKGFQT